MIKHLSLILAVAACGSLVPPPQFSIDPDFTPAEHEVIRSAVDAWCDKVNYCPDEVEDAGWGGIVLAYGSLDPEQEELLHDGGEVSGINRVSFIQMRADSKYRSQLDRFWVMVAHEIGHYCIPEHLNGGLMNWIQHPGSPMRIDAKAANAWIDGCSNW